MIIIMQDTAIYASKEFNRLKDDRGQMNSFYKPRMREIVQRFNSGVLVDYGECDHKRYSIVEK